MAARENTYLPRSGNRNSEFYAERSPVEVQRQYDHVVEEEPIDCTPGMCVHPAALFHWFEWLLFFILHFLVQVTCDSDTCTMILNEFGYKAMGQIYVLIVDFVLWCMVSVIIIGYSLNLHRSSLSGAILAVEKLYAIIGIIAMVIAGGVGTYCAVQANDPEINFMGRGLTHIQPQWIAAAVLEFIIAIVLIVDLLIQKREGYPFSVTLPKRAPKKAESDSTHALTPSAYNDVDANPYKPTSQPARFTSQYGQFGQFDQEPGMRRPMGRQENYF
uniref:MARVEL domain-containing protein n=1 Tax=Steinernema glaseri TaxID=37863 RepID=A0A1I7YS72_9BILA